MHQGKKGFEDALITVMKYFDRNFLNV